MSKRYDEQIEVVLGPPGHNVRAFRWRGRLYGIERVVKRWREAGQGWDPKRSRDCEYLRVEAEGGTYDLKLDLQVDQPQWRLARVWD